MLLDLKAPEAWRGQSFRSKSLSACLKSAIEIRGEAAKIKFHERLRFTPPIPQAGNPCCGGRLDRSVVAILHVIQRLLFGQTHDRPLCADLGITGRQLSLSGMVPRREVWDVGALGGAVRAGAG